MITLRKLSTLPLNTRRRKVIRILTDAERRYAHFGQIELDSGFLRGIARIVAEDSADSPRIGSAAALLVEKTSGSADATDLMRAVNELRHALLAAIGKEPAEWDLLQPLRAAQDSVSAGSATLPVTLYLEDVRSPFNVGSIIRTAAAFSAEAVVLSPNCASERHPRAVRSAMGATDFISVTRSDLDTLIERDVPVLALEQGGVPIAEYVFPERAVVVVGSEELGVSPRSLEVADHSAGRVSIELPGAKGSLNVGVAVGILLAWWAEKKPPAAEASRRRT